MYSSQARQADSSLCQEMMSAGLSTVTLALMKARPAMTWPCRISSVSAEMEERTGVETQAGGLRELAYSAETTD